MSSCLFRYYAPSKVILLAWMNDEDTKRASESGDYAFRVLRNMLAKSHPLDDLHQLLDKARTDGDRLQQIAAGTAQVQP
jgi:toxin YhaV